MLIAFVHSGRSFMPEVNAYIKYFSSRNISCVVTTPGELKNTARDVEWFFLGLDYSTPQKGIIRIHEYTSLSTPPVAGLKDFIKQKINTRPHYRIFLNAYVQEGMGFTDDVPFGFRDMGIQAEWLETDIPLREKKVDFIYTGDVSAQRKIPELLQLFTTASWRERTILVISQRYGELQQQFKRYPNISFTGPLPHQEVRDRLLTARYAVNFIPDMAPFNGQTSTKLLEYAAVKLPVVSTRYQWIKAFRETYGGEYFFLEAGLGNFNWQAISHFNYSFPNLANWTWEKQIERSGIVAFLRTKFPTAGL